MNYVLESPGVYRCSRCGHGVRTCDPTTIKGCVCGARDLLGHPCRYLGALTDNMFRCRGCPGSPRVHALFACERHGSCLPLANVPQARCCATCSTYDPQETPSC